LEAVGVIVEEPSATLTEVEGVPVLGEPEQLEKIVKQHKVDMVVMATPPDRSHRLLPHLSRLSFNSLNIIDMPSLYEHLCGKIPAQYISEVWLYMHSVYQHKTYYLRCKRLIDLAGAAVGLILTFPLLLLAALAIKLDSRGPVFFRQWRLGQENQPFSIFKLRTMFHENHDDSRRWADRHDPRVTRAGWVLRRLRLDELPQLLNVLKGEMSLIGPRAEWEVFARDALQPAIRWQPGRRATDPPGSMVPCGPQEQVPFYGFRTVVRPGITGWAQVMDPMAGSSPQELTEKLQYDLYYIKNMGFFLDLIILLKTLRIVLIGRGK
jgi:lipopolysaccharide/colanic/teichoic acid biosynthesis glycosyltransferase